MSDISVLPNIFIPKLFGIFVCLFACFLLACSTTRDKIQDIITKIQTKEEGEKKKVTNEVTKQEACFQIIIIYLWGHWPLEFLLQTVL